MQRVKDLLRFITITGESMEVAITDESLRTDGWLLYIPYLYTKCFSTLYCMIKIIKNSKIPPISFYCVWTNNTGDLKEM